jgi:hypothetical protein
MDLGRVAKGRLLLILSFLITPAFLAVVFLMWVSGGPFRITTLFLFPYAAMEMLTERFLRPPDTLGAPTYLAILIACIQYPIYAWIIGNTSEIARVKKKATAIAGCHLGICSLVLFLHFTGRL